MEGYESAYVHGDHARLVQCRVSPRSNSMFRSLQDRLVVLLEGATIAAAPSTWGRRLAAIRLVRLGAKLPSPDDAVEVHEILRGIRRAWKR